MNPQLSKETKFAICLSLFTIIVFLLLLTRCTSVEKRGGVAIPTPIQSPILSTPTPTPTPQNIIKPILPPPSDIINVINPALSWEKDHPERKLWSTALFKSIDEKFDLLDKAKDISKFCGKYSSLTKDQKKNVWAELFVWTAYYESAWNPNDQETDVGTDDDKNTWSISLLQLSVIDQSAYNIHLGYKYADLLLPENNLRLGVYIMARQIDRRGLVLLPDRKDLYWATLYPNGRYDESDAIINHVQKLGFCK